MAASSMDKDYIHQVQAGLSQKYPAVSLDIISVQNWETSSSRSKQLAKFDTQLANAYDLVIIQLGENVNDMTTFKKDFNKLVSHVQDAQPNAKIVVVGDYWYRYGRDAAQKDVPPFGPGEGIFDEGVVATVDDHGRHPVFPSGGWRFVLRLRLQIADFRFRQARCRGDFLKGSAHVQEIAGNGVNAHVDAFALTFFKPIFFS